MTSADLLIDARSPEIRHRTGITAPDAFLYLRTDDGADTVFFDAREFAIQRQKIDALGRRTRVEALEPYQTKAKDIEIDGSGMQKTFLAILRERGIDAVRVSPNLPYEWALFFERAGIALSMHDFPSERTVKTEEEIARMIEVQRVAEEAFELARGILRESVIDPSASSGRAGAQLRYAGDILTSERMKAELKAFFLRRGYSNPEGIIVASGEQTARPHDEGTGPLLAHQAIIIDIFPQNDETGYFADMTRTFVKGTPSKELRAIFDAVRDVQAEIADGIALGDTGDIVYRRTVEAFFARGYETSKEKGFMHGTGHGLGLAVHELPNLKPSSTDVLGPGMVVTVEPGLYYPGLGGARVEDVIVFHPDGRKENINRFDKEFLIP